MKRNIILGVVSLATLFTVGWYLVASRGTDEPIKAEARLSDTTPPVTETPSTPSINESATTTAETKESTTTTPPSGTNATATKPAARKHGKRRGGKLAKAGKGGSATTGTSSSSGLHTTQTGAQAGESPLEGSVQIGHLGAVGLGSRSFTEIAAELGYRRGKHHFAILQEARKLYLIAPQGENEVLVADTVLSHQYELSPDILSFQVKSLLGTTLPVSSESRRVKHVTRPTVGFIATRDLFGGAVTVEYTPTFNYFFNTEGTDPNRVPLRRMALGQKGEIGLHLFNRRMRWAGWAKWFYSMYQAFDDSTNTPSPTGSLEFGTYVDYRIVQGFNAQVGYVRGSSMLRNALSDAPFYDEHTSRVYGAVTVSF